MEIRKSLLGAVAAAALIAGAGGAYAADENSTMSPGTPSGSMSGSSTSSDSIKSPSEASPAPTTPLPGDRSSAGSMSSAQAGKPAQPPGFIVGKEVVNAQGDKIGTVSKIDGSNVIVSVGGFLGIGSHDVSLAWNQLSLSGTGDQAKLQTSLTKDELKAMPEYKADSSSSGTMRNGNSATGTGSTGANGVDRPLGATEKGNLNH